MSEVLRWFVVVAVVAFAAVSGGCRSGEKSMDDGRSDRAKLQGTWRSQSVEVHGKSVTETQTTIAFSGDRITLTETVGTSEGTFTVDATKTPREITIQFKDARTDWRGIYSLEGDLLRIRWTVTGQRPTGFETKGHLGTIYTMRREESK